MIKIKGLSEMVSFGLSRRIQFTFLVFILLFLPVYGYACVLPMLGSSNNASTCHLTDCTISDSQQATQKYCDVLKKVEAESSLPHQDALAKTTLGPLFTEFSILSEIPKAHWALSTFQEARFFTAPNLYILHHTLLL
jgi:hypothetical protein